MIADHRKKCSHFQKFEILQELPQCDTDTGREQTLGKTVPIDLLAADYQFVENAVVVKHNKRRCAYTL